MTTTPVYEDIPWPGGTRMFKVVCRLGQWLADGSDPDDIPDLRSLDGTVRITPITIDGRIKVFEDDKRVRIVPAMPQSFGIQPKTGELIDSTGRVGVKLLDPASESIDPRFWTYRADVTPTVGKEFSVIFTGALAENGVLDIAKVSSVTESPGITMTELEQLLSAIDTLNTTEAVMRQYLERGLLSARDAERYSAETKVSALEVATNTALTTANAAEARNSIAAMSTIRDASLAEAVRNYATNPTLTLSHDTTVTKEAFEVSFGSEGAMTKRLTTNVAPVMYSANQIVLPVGFRPAGRITMSCPANSPGPIAGYFVIRSYGDERVIAQNQNVVVQPGKTVELYAPNIHPVAPNSTGCRWIFYSITEWAINSVGVLSKVFVGDATKDDRYFDGDTTYEPTLKPMWTGEAKKSPSVLLGIRSYQAEELTRLMKVGVGRPDKPETTAGKIVGNEPEGCTYKSLDGDGVGAWEWVKRNGVWIVTNGDTGNVSLVPYLTAGVLQGGGDPSTGGGTEPLFIRRQNNWLYLQLSLSWVSITASKVVLNWDKLVGMFDYRGAIYANSGYTGGSVVNNGPVVTLYGAAQDKQFGHRVQIMRPIDAPWPSTLKPT